MWTAATFLKGDRPFRDFADLGDPLYWALSAFAQWVVGYRLIGEVGLGTLFAASALTIAFVLACHATTFRLLAALLTIVAALVHAEAQLYGYSKLFIYPFTVWMMWRYIDRPSLSRTIALAATVAGAFLFRHDHGVYTGAGAMAAILATHFPAWRVVGRESLRFAAAVFVLLVPFLVAVQLSEGVVSYFAERLRIFAFLDDANRRSPAFRVDPSAPAHWLAVLEPEPARVFVSWQPAVDETMRATLERRYGLTSPRATSAQNNFEYALVDTGAENIRALVQDPATYDTGLIDRDRFRPAEESWIVDLYRRVPLFRISVAPRYWHRDNVGVAAHWLARAAPFLLLLLWGVTWRSARTAAEEMPRASKKTFAAAILALAAFTGLLRRIGYFEDHTAMTVVLLACCVAHARQSWRSGASWPVRGISTATAAVLLLAWVGTSISYAESMTSLKAMNDNWRGLWWQRSVEHYRTYSVSPPIDQYAPRDNSGRSLIRYVYECTSPDDRVWVLTEMFNFPYYTERRIVRHINWSMGFLRSDEQQRRTLEMLARDSVPIIISESRHDPLQDLRQYPLIHAQIAPRYTNLHVVRGAQDGALNFYVLADSRRTPTRAYGDFQLPCFR